MKSKGLGIAAVLTAAVGSSVALKPPAAEATINGYWWWATADTLSNPNYSNESGFWQDLMCSNSGDILVDGWFGPSTQAKTAAFQGAGFLHLDPAYYSPGVVNAYTWAEAQVAPGALVALGNGDYHYYAGGQAMRLYWNGGSGTWKFRYNPGTTSHLEGPSSQWIMATWSRTISGGTCVISG